MPPAAFLICMHQCPLQTVIGPVTIPHVGGPILGPCSSNVKIGGLPAAKVGDVAFCIGPPDRLIKGSQTVKINGQPAVRMGDKTAHGGTVLMGHPLVWIGG
jgi:uncharacterized Zn-binding protein involved in type VI secretion